MSTALVVFQASVVRLAEQLCAPCDTDTQETAALKRALLLNLKMYMGLVQRAVGIRPC